MRLVVDPAAEEGLIAIEYTCGYRWHVPLVLDQEARCGPERGLQGGPVVPRFQADHGRVVLRAPAAEGWKDYTKTAPIQFEEFAACQVWWTRHEENKRAWNAPPPHRR